MKSQIRWIGLGLLALCLGSATVRAGAPDGGSSRGTVTVTAYVLPKSTCTLSLPNPGQVDPSAIRCQTAGSQPKPVVRMERERADSPKVVLTVLP